MATLEEIITRDDLQEYTADGRAAVNSLFAQYCKLRDEHSWLVSTAYEQPVTLPSGEALTLPVIAVHTKTTGPALWILAGIHGEEPAGPNAVAENIALLANLAQKNIPIVVFPLCNPSGYRRDWRYPDEYRDFHTGHSIGDSDHLLPRLDQPTVPRLPQPSSPDAAAFSAHVHALTKTYPPRIVIDHHEDESLLPPYIYSQGIQGPHDPVAIAIVKLLLAAGMPLEMRGVTRFGEDIVEGVVSSNHDGSIDEFLAAKEIIDNGRVVPGPSASTVVAVETPVIDVPLPKRIAAHASIVAAYEKFWDMVK
ncbi:MAG: hypothetical protein WEA04_02615 [Candidatus Andersenbacteria bacterium]